MRDTTLNLAGRKRHTEQPSALTLVQANNLRRSAGEAMDAFPLRGNYKPFIPSKMTRMREGQGGPGDVALLLWLAPTVEAEESLMGLFRGVLNAKHGRTKGCIREAMLREHEADMEEDTVSPVVWADPTPENLGRWLPGAYRQRSATDEAIALAEAIRAEAALGATS